MKINLLKLILIGILSGTLNVTIATTALAAEDSNSSNVVDGEEMSGLEYLNFLKDGIKSYIDSSIIYFSDDKSYPRSNKTTKEAHSSAKKMWIWKSKSEADCEDHCDTHNLSAICQTKMFADLTKGAKSFPENFKNIDELEGYFYNYRADCEDAAHKNYLKEYKYYISAAAENFGVPEVLLSCLLFRENQFLKSRRSASGARGISQIMPRTTKYISTIIKYSESEQDEVEKYYKIVKNFNSKTAKGLATAKRAQYYKDYEYSRSIVKNHSLSQDWTRYIDKLKKIKAFKKQYPFAPWIGSHPTYFDIHRAEVPPLAIGASALYLKDILIHLAQGREQTLKDHPEQLLNLLTAVSGAYNIGPGTASRIIGNPPPKDTKVWIEKLGRASRETKSHMESIKNCMEKDNLKPPLQQGNNGKAVGQTKCAK